MFIYSRPHLLLMHKPLPSLKSLRYIYIYIYILQSFGTSKIWDNPTNNAGLELGIFHSMSRMRVAVVGTGISGLVSAYVLAKAGAEVVLYEKEDSLGGHAKTVCFDGVDLDLGFMVFNRVSNCLSIFHSSLILCRSLAFP